MVEFLAAGVILGALVFSIIQCALLWAGQGAVETASHFAARKFALTARADCRRAKEAALAEAPQDFVASVQLPPDERIEGFDEIEIGYSERQAREEAGRCLRCDLEE